MQLLSFQQVLLPRLENVNAVEIKKVTPSLTNFTFQFETSGESNVKNKKVSALVDHSSSPQDWLIFTMALTTVKAFSHLKVFKLHIPFFTEDKVIEVLRKSPFLHTLEMGGEQFDHSNQLVEALGSTCPQLEVLNLSYSPRIDDEGIKHLKNCKKLREVNFSACSSISDAGVEQFLSASHASLETLILFKNPQLTARSLQAMRQCTKLKYLNMGCCPGISSRNVFDFLSACEGLEALFLEELSMDMEDAFPEKSLAKFRKLSLRGTHIEDDKLSWLAERTPHLNQLNLSQCLHLSYLGILKAIEQLSKTELKILDLCGCRLFVEEISYLQQKFPSIHFLSEYSSM